ncbi:lipoprotein [Gordonia spumicola]|uniref:Lipoprotein n=2 Tax=Gordonia spumicola TaxID=589161 RepID=A0A7I9VEU3_9ACTN|nr:lipoprotein [Gordonia spumicola]
MAAVTTAALFVMVGASAAPVVSPTAADSGIIDSNFRANAPVRPQTPATRTITISWVGDNILGTDKDFGGGTLPELWARSGDSPDYFFQNVKRYFSSDDLTVANFEVALTKRRQERYKGDGETYHFFGDPAVAKSLPAAGIDVVTLANNHTYDYGRGGFEDTTRALDAVGVDYVGTGDASEGSDYDFRVIRDVKGVRVGLVGYQAWADTPSFRAKIRTDFSTLRAEGAQVVIPYFHWGIESQNRPYEVQTSLARYAIDQGADAIIGTHPHVLQSMSTYKGKLIAYSLGNFSFGGNTNPSDKRTMILQTRLTVTGETVSGAEYRVIPTRLSSKSEYNDYVPTPYRGAEKAEALAFINEISPDMNGRIGTRFRPVR